MSRRRFAKAYPYEGKGPSGRNLCRWCGVEVRPPRRTWCSDACVHEWRIRSDGTYVRSLVWERDKGICAGCRLDTRALEKKLRALWREGKREERRALKAEMIAQGWPPFMRLPSRWWDADHIVPVIEGGGECGLENYRTLCVPCHRRVTAELAVRRALQRKVEREKAPPLFN